MDSIGIHHVPSNYSLQRDAADDIELLPKGYQNIRQRESQIQENGTYDRGESTRYFCLATLLVSWIIGIICIVLAATYFRGSDPREAEERYLQLKPHLWPQISVSPVVGELLPLLLNAAMTVLLDGLGLIHATTLRWGLEKKLTFNANLRLFSSSRTSLALGAPTNLLFALLLILCYTSTSLFFVNSPSFDFCKQHQNTGIDFTLDDCADDVHVSPPALYCLGIGLIGQSALATWQYVSVKVPSWTSNPLDAAWAMAASGTITRTPGRSILAVHDSILPLGPQPAPTKQQPIWTAHSQIRWIMILVWSALAFSYIFFISILAVIKANLARVGNNCNDCGTYAGTNWNVIPDLGGSATSTAIIVEQSSTVHIGLFIVVFLVTAVVTLTLHCAELVTVLRRDEKTWRQCTTDTPYVARQNAAVRAVTSWPFLVLFALKVILHWISGKGVAYIYNFGIFLRPPQLLYLALGMTILAGFATFLAFERPRGPQPAAFGHLETLVNVIDEWSLMMYWGDKGRIEDRAGYDEEVRRAGTSNLPLGQVMTGTLYK